MRRVCRRASCRRARRRRNDAGSVSLHLGGGSPAAPRIALSAYRFSRQRGSFRAPVFRQKWDVRFAPPYVKWYTAPTYPPPLGKRVTPALRCAQRYTEVKGEPFGLQSARGGFAVAVNPFSLRACLPVLLFAAARELSHVCLSAEVGHLRCAAYEAVCGIRSGRDKLSVLLDAEVAYGFGVIPLVQRLAPTLHRVKRCAEEERTTGRKGAACRGCGQSTVPARCFVRVRCFSQPRGSFRTPVFRRKRGPRFAPPYLRRCALSVQFRSDGGRPPAFFAREAAHGFDVSPLGRRPHACSAREAVTQLRRIFARTATATRFALRETVRRSRGAVSRRQRAKARSVGRFVGFIPSVFSDKVRQNS